MKKEMSSKKEPMTASDMARKSHIAQKKKYGKKYMEERMKNARKKRWEKLSTEPIA